MLLTNEEKIVVYTAIIGDYDKNIVKSTYYDPNLDIVIFINNKKPAKFPQLLKNPILTWYGAAVSFRTSNDP